MRKASAPTVKTVLARLEALGEERVRALNIRAGATGPQFGVKLGEIRKIAAQLGSDGALAAGLWESGNLDAMLLAILVMKPAALPTADVDRMVRQAGSAQVADWFNGYVARKHPARESLREKWMSEQDPWAARAGWSLTADRMAKDAKGLDPDALLDRIESGMADAPGPVQWTMNMCLAAIGIHSPAHRARALAIGESLGLYRDYPVSKGCTSPFAPAWINEMVRRNRKAS